MKKNLLAVLFAVLCQAVVSAQENPCIENGAHWGGWQVDYCLSLNQAGSLSATSLYGNEGDVPCLPTITVPTYNAGRLVRVGTFECTTDTTNDYSALTPSVSSVSWDPPLPEKWSIPLGLSTTFLSTAYVTVDDGNSDFNCDPGRVNIGTATWTIAGKWQAVSLNINNAVSAVKTAINGVKSLAEVAGCDSDEDFKCEVELGGERRNAYCSCTSSDTKMESKFTGKVSWRLAKIECPLPSLCLPPIKIGKAGKAVAGAYATFETGGDVTVKVTAAAGCGDDSICIKAKGNVEAGFKVKAEVCFISKEYFSASASGSVAAEINMEGECCHNAEGSFDVTVSPLKLSYVVKAKLVGFKYDIAKGEVNVFKGGHLGPYNFDCPF